MISGFSLMVKRREKRQRMKLSSGLCTICDSTWPDQSHAWKCARKLDPMAGSLCLQFLRHATWMTLLFMVIGHFRVPKTLTFKMRLGDFHIKGWAPTLVLKQRPRELGNGLFQCCLLVSRIMFFPQLLSRYKRIEIIIKIKANFHKKITQFTILVAIIGNKISKYFFLTSLSQILYISTQQTYTSGKFNSSDSAWYRSIFFFWHIKQSFNNKRHRRKNNRTILTKHMFDLTNLLPVRSSVIIDWTKSSL